MTATLPRSRRTTLVSDYEELLLHAMPRPCVRALDVGCGHGRFARRLAQLADEVDALDRVDLGVAGPSNLRFIHGDFLTAPIEPERYDFVCAIASLHHLPFDEAIEKMARALRPGGVLAILGLYRESGVVDFAWSVAAFPVSRWRRWRRPPPSSRAPLCEPHMTLDEIHAESERLLPGACVERHLLWRYTLIWTKPQ
jgi:SAM-dependent methyltransferase